MVVRRRQILEARKTFSGIPTPPERKEATTTYSLSLCPKRLERRKPGKISPTTNRVVIRMIEWGSVHSVVYVSGCTRHATSFYGQNTTRNSALFRARITVGLVHSTGKKLQAGRPATNTQRLPNSVAEWWLHIVHTSILGAFSKVVHKLLYAGFCCKWNHI